MGTILKKEGMLRKLYECLSLEGGDFITAHFVWKCPENVLLSMVIITGMVNTKNG